MNFLGLLVIIYCIWELCRDKGKEHDDREEKKDEKQYQAMLERGGYGSILQEDEGLSERLEKRLQLRRHRRMGRGEPGTLKPEQFTPETESLLLEHSEEFVAKTWSHLVGKYRELSERNRR